MKILWFTNTSASYKSQKTKYNGGGWITALESAIKNQPNIELGISFYSKDDCFKIKQNDVTYYPIGNYNIFSKIVRYFNYIEREKQDVDLLLKVVDDFKPDLIHVFGSESSFGLLTKYTDIPIILHIQGFLIPCVNSWFPPGYSIKDFISPNLLNLKDLFFQYRAYRINKYMAPREKRILQSCHYFMGRTEWDKNISRLYSPMSKYFYCGEMLRSSFYNTELWSFHNERKKIVIVSTISNTLYKGGDLILKTAKILKETTTFDFEWLVFGVSKMKYEEFKTKIKATDVSVNLMGVVDESILCRYLINSDVFVHPSYIDNSSNSVCEAQLLGVPVIASSVGGICSLIDNAKTGLLFPSNDPYTLATYIIRLSNDKEFAQKISINAHNIASTRHDPDSIIKTLFDIYNTLLY